MSESDSNLNTGTQMILVLTRFRNGANISPRGQKQWQESTIAAAVGHIETSNIDDDLFIWRWRRSAIGHCVSVVA